MCVCVCGGGGDDVSAGVWEGGRGEDWGIWVGG